jgi:hypothetical protein
MGYSLLIFKVVNKICKDKAQGGRLYGWNKGPTRQRHHHAWAPNEINPSLKGFYMNVKIIHGTFKCKMQNLTRRSKITYSLTPKGQFVIKKSLQCHWNNFKVIYNIIYLFIIIY